MDSSRRRGRKRTSIGQEIDRITDRDRKTPRNALGLTQFTLYTALAIVSITNTSFSLAVDWLRDPRRRGVPLTAGHTNDGVKQYLEDIVLASTGAEIDAWGCSQRAPCPQALRAAHIIVARYNMTQRCCLANYQHGVAPSSRTLLRQYKAETRTLWVQGVELPSIALVRQPDSSSPRTFMYRWRKKMGVKFGRVRFGEPLTMEQKRAKVKQGFLEILSPIWVHFSASRGRSAGSVS